MTLFLQMMILLEKYICYYRTQGFFSMSREIRFEKIKDVEEDAHQMGQETRDGAATVSL